MTVASEFIPRHAQAYKLSAFYSLSKRALATWVRASLRPFGTTNTLLLAVLVAGGHDGFLYFYLVVKTAHKEKCSAPWHFSRLKKSAILGFFRSKHLCVPPQELAVMVARGRDGSLCSYPVVETGPQGRHVSPSFSTPRERGFFSLPENLVSCFRNSP